MSLWEEIEDETLDDLKQLKTFILKEVEVSRLAVLRSGHRTQKNKGYLLQAEL